MDLDKIDTDAPMLDPGGFRPHGGRGKAHRAGAPPRQGALRRRAPPGTTARRASPPRTTTTCAMPACSASVRAQGARRARGRIPRLHDDGRGDRPLLRRHRAHLQHARVLVPVDRPALRRPHHERGGPRRAPAPPRHPLRPHRQGRRHLRPALLRGRRCGGRRGAVLDRGQAGRRRLARQRQEDFRLAVGLGRLLRRPVRRGEARPAALAARHHVYRCPGQGRGRPGGRRLGPARHARHRLAHAHLQGRASSTTTRR